ncbi:hypothetical protein D1872_265440 [compost metagenome]
MYRHPAGPYITCFRSALPIASAVNTQLARLQNHTMLPRSCVLQVLDRQSADQVQAVGPSNAQARTAPDAGSAPHVSAAAAIPHNPYTEYAAVEAPVLRTVVPALARYCSTMLHRR